MAKNTLLPVTMSVKRAQELLANNKNNRRVSQQLVSRYQRDMEEGRWKLNGAAILVADTGRLLDGQHRLLACVRAKQPFQTFIIEGLPEDIMDTIDAGRKRSGGDVLGLRGIGEGYAPGVAASARLVLNYVRGDSLQASQSNSAILQLVDAYPDLVTFHIMARPSHSVIQSSALGAILFLGTRAPGMDKRADAFATGVAKGADLREDDARLALRATALNVRARSPGGRGPLTMWAFMACATAWNAFVRQEPLTRIKLQPNEAGRILPPDILGGPKRAEGVDSLRNVRLHTNRLRAMAAKEADQPEAAA